MYFRGPAYAEGATTTSVMPQFQVAPSENRLWWFSLDIETLEVDRVVCPSFDVHYPLELEKNSLQEAVPARINATCPLNQIYKQFSGSLVTAFDDPSSPANSHRLGLLLVAHKENHIPTSVHDPVRLNSALLEAQHEELPLN